MTVASGDIDLLPFFLETPRGRLFAVRRAPESAPRGAVLYLPPFAEELNMTRRMAALGASALARAGYAVTTLDPLGCGDSDGGFADGDPEAWREDVALAVDRLADETGGKVIVWGLRLGAALAAQAARDRSGAVARLVLWQPVASGRQMLNRFLRVRVAAGLARSGPAETTVGLRERIAAGEPIEVAGYEIGARLAESLDAIELAALAPPADVAVDWFEVVQGDDVALPQAAERVIAAWREAGTTARTRVIPGEAFWSIQETTLVPPLIAATVEALA